MEKDIYVQLTKDYRVNLSAATAIEMARKKRYGRKWKSIFSRLKGMLIWEQYEHQYINNDGDILFLASINVFQRKDYLKIYQDVESTYEKFDTLSIKSENAYIKIGRIVKLIIKLLLWYKQLRRQVDDKKDIVIYLYNLIQIYECYNIFEKINIEKYKLGLVFYDNWLFDNSFVQYFHSHNLKVATLQHAQFVATRDIDNFEFWGIHYKNSISDYFLAWNNYTKDEAKKDGMREEKIKILGIPKYINYTDWIENKADKGIFGVILCKQPEEDNIKLLKIAEQVALQTGLSYYIKYHPAYKGDEYKNLVCNSQFMGVVENTVQICDYCKLVDFTLIANSTVYVELVYMKQKVFRMDTGKADIYYGVNTGTFKTTDDVIELYKNRSIEDNDKLFEYLCTVENPKERYTSFFEQI